MKKKCVDALTIPSGPTISGEISANGINIVGGDVVSIDKLPCYYQITGC